MSKEKLRNILSSVFIFTASLLYIILLWFIAQRLNFCN